MGSRNIYFKGVVMEKGIFYSILTIILLIPIITLSSTYSETLRGYGVDIGYNVRMKSGLYFLNSVNEDFDRAVQIIGRRSITACLNHVINEGEGLDSAEDLIVELFENKTLNGTPSDIMDYNIYEWMNKSNQIAEKRGFFLERELKSVSISMEDPWNVMFHVDFYIKLGDKGNLFSYEKNVTKSIPVSIVGLEDPMYILNTQGKITRKVEKYEGYLTNLILSSSGGNGWDSGVSIKTDDPSSVSNKDEKVYVNETVSSSHSSFAGVVAESNSTSIGTAYVTDNDWDNVKNNTRIVVEGNQGEVWEIENLYNLHENKLYIAGNGPSYLDRLEGKLVNTYPGAGLESLVDKDEIIEKTGSCQDRSNVDYIYFNTSILNIYKVKGMPATLSWEFRIDEDHRPVYGVNNTLNYA